MRPRSAVAPCALLVFTLAHVGCVLVRHDLAIEVLASRSTGNTRGALNPKVHAICANVARRHGLQENHLVSLPPSFIEFSQKLVLGRGQPSISLAPGSRAQQTAVILVACDFDHELRSRIAEELRADLAHDFGGDAIRVSRYEYTDW